MAMVMVEMISRGGVLQSVINDLHMRLRAINGEGLLKGGGGVCSWPLLPFSGLKSFIHPVLWWFWSWGGIALMFLVRSLLRCSGVGREGRNLAGAEGAAGSGGHGESEVVTTESG